MLRRNISKELTTCCLSVKVLKLIPARFRFHCHVRISFKIDSRESVQGHKDTRSESVAYFLWHDVFKILKPATSFNNRLSISHLYYFELALFGINCRGKILLPGWNTK